MQSGVVCKERFAKTMISQTIIIAPRGQLRTKRLYSVFRVQKVIVSFSKQIQQIKKNKFSISIWSVKNGSR